MGKASRVARRLSSAASATQLSPAELSAVGQREPCPCGSGARSKNCHGRRIASMQTSAATSQSRMFVGLPSEADWVALREFVPAATAPLRTQAQHGNRELTLTTVLPMGWAAMHRSDGVIFVALQTLGAGDDPNADVAHAVLRALATDPGEPIAHEPAPADGPRLDEVIDTAGSLKVTVHDTFNYWMAEGAELDEAARTSLAQANDSIVPTARLASTPAAYWCQIGPKRHLRWVLTDPEEELLDGLARLHAAGKSAVLPGARYAGAFRADGLVVPVWDLPAEADADATDVALKGFAAELQVAVAATAALTPAERRARAGIVSRQVTLR